MKSNQRVLAWATQKLAEGQKVPMHVIEIDASHEGFIEPRASATIEIAPHLIFRCDKLVIPPVLATYVDVEVEVYEEVRRPQTPSGVTVGSLPHPEPSWVWCRNDAMCHKPAPGESFDTRERFPTMDPNQKFVLKVTNKSDVSRRFLAYMTGKVIF